jgi:hypothetical protein
MKDLGLFKQAPDPLNKAIFSEGEAGGSLTTESINMQV